MSEPSFQQGLKKRHIYLIALGSAIGTGLFYGSSNAIQLAGPSVLLAYIIAGLAVFFVMRSLGEMALRKPLSGSFGSYATLYISPLAGFITGWSYVFEMALVCLADITAFATYMKFWYPSVDPWIWTLGVTFLIGGFNLMPVKVYGEFEFWLSMIKVLAIVGMIVAGVSILLFGFGHHGEGSGYAPTLTNLWKEGGFFPNGVTGFLMALSVVVFAFGGIEVIGLTIIEAKDSHESIPKAINTIPFRILLFYVMAIGIIMALIPWHQIGIDGSPFVLIFERLGIHWAADLLNFVVVTAAVSAINSDLYGAGRMIHGLSEQNQAPNWLGKLSQKGVPSNAVFVMSGTLIVGVVLNYFYHDGLFFIIAALATFATVLVWLMILLSQMAMRLKMSQNEVDRLAFPVLFWPIGPIIALLFILFTIVMLGVYDNTRSALWVGLLWIALLIGVYGIFYRKRA